MRKLLLLGGLLVALAVPAFAGSALAGQKVLHFSVYSYSLGQHKVTVTKGTKIVWTWTKGNLQPHSVTVSSGPAHFSSKIQSHGTYSHTFTKAGIYHLYCQVHPTMMMQTIIVH